MRVGLHDELFQGSRPVLAAIDARSTYCYLLAAETHRDAHTRGVHLLAASKQWLAPGYTIADAAQGLRAGQKAAWGDTPCHGDVFHVQRQCEGLANTLSNLARGARSRREKPEGKIKLAHSLDSQLKLARQTETRAHRLAGDMRTLTEWLNRDILALAGPVLATRRALFDFRRRGAGRSGFAKRTIPLACVTQKQRVLNHARFDETQRTASLRFYWLAPEVAPGICAALGAGTPVVLGVSLLPVPDRLQPGKPPAMIATAPTKNMLRIIDLMAVSLNRCDTVSEAMLMPLSFSESASRPA